MARGSQSNRGSTDPLGDLLNNLRQNPIPGFFSSSVTSVPDNSVVLDDWWLVRADVEGESKKLAISGYIAKKDSRIPFISAPIVKRHDTFTLEAADGVIVKVEGMINLINTQNNGFSHEVCQQFKIGFPFLWKQYINSCVDSAPTLDASTLENFEHFATGNTSGSNDESTAEEVETEHEDNPTLSDNMGAEAAINLEKEDTAMVSDAPQHGRRKRSNKKQTDDKEPSTRDTSHSGNNRRGKEPVIADIEHEESATPEKDETSSNSKLPMTRKRKNAIARSEVPDIRVTSRKGSSNNDHTLQTTPKTTGPGRVSTSIEVPDVRRSPRLSREKDHVMQRTPNTTGLGRRHTSTEVPDVRPSSCKGSSKKDHLLQATPKTAGLGHPRTNTEAHRATISPPSSESNICRSRSGRALISAVDKGSQKVLYDKKGNFLGIKTVS